MVKNRSVWSRSRVDMTSQPLVCTLEQCPWFRQIPPKVVLSLQCSYPILYTIFAVPRLFMQRFFLRMSYKLLPVWITRYLTCLLTWTVMRSNQHVQRGLYWSVYSKKLDGKLSECIGTLGWMKYSSPCALFIAPLWEGEGVCNQIKTTVIPWVKKMFFLWTGHSDYS